MQPQILIRPTQLAFTSGVMSLETNQLPATIQADILNGDTIVINSFGGFAQGLLNTIGGDFVDGDTVTIGSQKYTFVTTLSSQEAPNEIRIGTLAINTQGHFANAINGVRGSGSGAGSNYGNETPENVDVFAEEDDGGTATLFVIAKKVGPESLLVGTSTDAAGGPAWDDATLQGGSSAVSEGGTPITLTKNNNRIAVNSPVRIQAVKIASTIPIGVTVAYRDQV